MKILIKESQYKVLTEQITPVKKIEPSFFEKMVTKYLIPASEVVAPAVGGVLGVGNTVYEKYANAGRKIYNDFASIVNRRIEYNKKNKLPLDKMTPEEISYRDKLLKSTPQFGYPNIVDFLSVIDNIQSGKITSPTDPKHKKSIFDIAPKNSEDNSKFNSRDELKKMWFGLDDPNGLKTGEWVQSKWTPATSKDPKAVYYMPKTGVPILTQKEFDLVYNEILKTKLPDGKFPGGNSETIMDSKTLPSNIKEKFSKQNQLGHYKLGASIDNNKKYISFYDEWDLAPPVLTKMGINVQQFGKTPLIYYRVYRP